jgi:hypothetical protein
VNAIPIERPDAPAGRAWQALPTVASLVGALLLVLMAISAPLEHAARQSMVGGLAGAPLVLACAGVGVVVARRKPRNLMGWILLGIGIGFVLESEASNYLIADYRLHGGSWPLGSVALLLQPAWAPAVLLCGMAVLLFPDGRLPPNRLRWVALLVAAIGAVWIAGAYGIAAKAIVDHHVVIDSTGNLVNLGHPTGGEAWWGDVQTAFFPLLFGSWILWLGWQVQSYRRARGERRLQLKWLLSGAASFTVSLPLLFLSNGSTVLEKALGGLALCGLAALPISIGVGILKFRLYEIDRLISRTISYAVLTAALVAVFAGIVTLTTRVLPFSSPVAVAASTLAAAALFNPLRIRVQHLVDRRFNRARYDSEGTIAAFAARLQVAVDLDTVRNDLLAAAGTVQPSHASVWIRPQAGSEGRASR